MKKYAVWASLGASVHVGDYEAESADQAIQMAHDDPKGSLLGSIQ